MANPNNAQYRDISSDLSAALDAMLEGCQIISPDFRYLYVNDAVAAQGKRTKEELTGKAMRDMYPGIEQTEMFKHLKNVMQDRKPYTMENEFIFPDKTVGWFELRLEPVPQGVLILSLDITERKQLEAERKRLLDIRTNFIKETSKDIRKPLSTIQSELTELLASEGLAPQHKERLARADQASKKIVEQLHKLLTALDEVEPPRLIPH